MQEDPDTLGRGVTLRVHRLLGSVPENQAVPAFTDRNRFFGSFSVLFLCLLFCVLIFFVLFLCLEMPVLETLLTKLV